VASLINTLPQAFLEVLHHSLQHGGRNCCHFVPDGLFQVHRCPWFLFVHLGLETSPEKGVLRLGTLIPMNMEVPTKYQLSHNDRIVVFKIVSTAKIHCCTDQRSMATEMLWVSLEGRSRTNSPRQRLHSQLCYQIVRYFCRTLYKSGEVWSVDWIFITGAPAWRWLGEYVTLDKTFYSLIFKPEVVTARVISELSSLLHCSRRPLLEI